MTSSSSISVPISRKRPRGEEEEEHHPLTLAGLQHVMAQGRQIVNVPWKLYAGGRSARGCYRRIAEPVYRSLYATVHLMKAFNVPFRHYSPQFCGNFKIYHELYPIAMDGDTVLCSWKMSLWHGSGLVCIIPPTQVTDDIDPVRVEMRWHYHFSRDQTRDASNYLPSDFWNEPNTRIIFQMECPHPAGCFMKLRFSSFLGLCYEEFGTLLSSSTSNWSIPIANICNPHFGRYVPSPYLKYMLILWALLPRVKEKALITLIASFIFG